MDEMPQIERIVDLPAEPEEVWRRIVDGDLAEEWMGVRVVPRVGGPVTVSDRDVIGTVEEVEPGAAITWSWREMTDDPSQVTIELQPVDGGTRIKIVERLLRFEMQEFPPVFMDRVA